MLKSRADELGLDPVSGQIHLIKRNKKEEVNGKETWVKKYVFVIGIDGFRLIAERSKKYDGQDAINYIVIRDGKEVRTDVVYKTDTPVAAIATVYKKGINRPFVAVAHYEDYVQKTGTNQITAMWKKWPTMLSKCAEALSIRKGFPELNLGAIYEEAEINPLDNEETAGHDKQKPPWAAFEPKTCENAKQEATTPVDASKPGPVDESKAEEKEPSGIRAETNPAESSPESVPTKIPANESANPEPPKPTPTDASNGIKMATDAQIKAIQTISAKKGISYDPLAFSDVTFDQAAEMIKKLNAAKKEVK